MRAAVLFIHAAGRMRVTVAVRITVTVRAAVNRREFGLIQLTVFVRVDFIEQLRQPVHGSGLFLAD